MTDRSRCRRAVQPVSSGPAQTPTPTEPPVRRWPHPVEGTAPAPDLESALHYIRCALSYQNQLLADIKTLLQQLTPEEGGNSEDS